MAAGQSKRSKGAPGLKALITVGSVVGTIVGWGTFAAHDTNVAAQAPQSDAPAVQQEAPTPAPNAQQAFPRRRLRNYNNGGTTDGSGQSQVPQTAPDDNQSPFGQMPITRSHSSR
jgi:hypothetical protein